MTIKCFAVTLLALPLLATTTFAQVAIPPTALPATPPDLAPQAQPSPAKDEAAGEKLHQMVAAYDALKSFAVTVELRQAVATGTQVANSAPTQRARVQWQRPNRVRVVTRNPNGETGAAKAISDGKNIYVAYSFAPGQYVKRPVPAKETIQQTILAGGAGGPGAALAFGNGNKAQLEAFFKSARSYSLGEAETLDGIATETVIVHLPFRSDAMRYTFSIGQTDHLLRRLKLNYAAKEGSIEVVETHSDLEIDPVLPDSTWDYVPPKGAKSAMSLEPPTFDAHLQVGTTPFPIATKDLQGRALSLSQFKGKVVLLDFWATWCGPCVGEAPNVVKAYNAFKPRGFDIVGISLDQDRKALDAFVKSHNMPWRQVFDGRGWGSEIGKIYGVKAIPFTLLIGRDGKIAAINPRGPALEIAIRSALAKKA